MDKITPALLVHATGCTLDRAAVFAFHIDEACQHYGINTPLRLAHFLAQIGHESCSLKWVREIWGPTQAQTRYEGRADLGNTRPGDGVRYLGRGLIQTTGRANYRSVAERLRQHGAPDFEIEPERLESPEWAAWSAADYWAMRNINAAADADDLVRVTRLVNGGLNGIDDRKRRLEAARAALGAPAAEPVAPVPPVTPTITPPETKEPAMPVPIAGIVAALLPTLMESIPRLGKLFSSGSKTSERNLEAAGVVMEIVREATGSVNAQEAVEKIKAEPEALAAATKAVEDNWFALTESGGGGVDGARKADAAAVARGEPLWRSPSFVIGMCLLPLVYLIVGAVVGIIGQPFSEDVRAAIANGIVGLVLGGLIGYYYGQTTSRNRTPAPQQE